jgi:hypothetical protein
MFEEHDPQIPKPSTTWQLWQSDTFDRDSSPALQSNGTRIIDGLCELWFQTLKEGILDNGNASFSYFYLIWDNATTARVDITVSPFNNLALLKLRHWVGFTPQAQNIEVGRNKLVLRLAHLHHTLLQKSSRWHASAIDWSAEAREVLGRVELISNPEDL